MKKLALLYAVMTLGMSSWAFAADNPPPPPEKGAQHQGKPPVKTANTKVSKRNTTANSHNETANSRSTTVNSRSTTASSRQRERAQRETAAAEKRNTLARLPRQAFFILRQPSLTNSCRSLRCPKKSLHCA